MSNNDFKEVVKLSEYKKIKGQLVKVDNGIEQEFRLWKGENWKDFLNQFFGTDWKITSHCTIEKKYCKTCFLLSRYFEKAIDK